MEERKKIHNGDDHNSMIIIMSIASLAYSQDLMYRK